jgi:hypothetical protein
MREDELLWCSCCGKGLRNNAEENTDYGKVPYPHDDEFGMCVECGGNDKIGTDDTVDQLTDAQLKKRMGWAMTMFIEARIPIVSARLSPVNAAKFDKLPLWHKAAFIVKMVESGKMI